MVERGMAKEDHLERCADQKVMSEGVSQGVWRSDLHSAANETAPRYGREF
jgi:hypothetical protein